MKVQVKIIPGVLVLINLACLVLIVFRSEILSQKHFGGESLFVFSSMALLVQPIPSIIGSLLSGISVFQKIFNNHYGVILYAGTTGCIQWYLIGISLLECLELKNKIGVFCRAYSALLFFLGVALIAYTLALFFINLTSLRNFTEKSFFVLWALFVIMMPIHLLRRIIFATKKSTQ